MGLSQYMVCVLYEAKKSIVMTISPVCELPL